MAKRQVYVEGVGEVSITKNRRNTNLRLRVKPGGLVFLSMPAWTPYIVGERFVKSRRAWLKEQLRKNPTQKLKHGDLIGKNHRLSFCLSDQARIKTKVGQTTIEITSCKVPEDDEVQKKAVAACEQALKLQSKNLLRQRLEQLSRQHNLPYREFRVRSLKSRWGSCSSKNAITISFYVIQLPWELVDYVLLHELVHTKYMNHSRRFWSFFEEIMPAAKAHRRQIKAFNPQINPA